MPFSLWSSWGKFNICHPFWSPFPRVTILVRDRLPRTVPGVQDLGSAEPAGATEAS